MAEVDEVSHQTAFVKTPREGKPIAAVILDTYRRGKTGISLARIC
jgi:hypothetical protein